MREIKFRAQDIASNKWLYGDLRHHSADVCIFEQGGTKGEQVKRETVGQFTGLQDDNGNDMYEGDVIHIKGRFYDCNCYIGVRNGQFAIFDAKKGCLIGYFRGNAPHRCIVGNIHDNPELIK